MVYARHYFSYSSWVINSYDFIVFSSRVFPFKQLDSSSFFPIFLWCFQVYFYVLGLWTSFFLDKSLTHTKNRKSILPHFNDILKVHNMVWSIMTITRQWVPEISAQCILNVKQKSTKLFFKMPNWQCNLDCSHNGRTIIVETWIAKSIISNPTFKFNAIIKVTTFLE